ncbi:nucleotide exchange factor SIL1 [Aplysia californica]|uniref:Nucleotide exchange factor SIL1 n=1 Tax=Aplysia californica TaxID=6500 RepID=A0ABM0JGM1_APLCA|nr:nucleotide exchange factor SIL1 [Aplysia californica]
MSIFRKSIQVVAQVLVVFSISQLFMHNLWVSSEQTQQIDKLSAKSDDHAKSALVFVKDTDESDTDEDDGIVSVEDNENDVGESVTEEFVATEEWQEVKKGQKIPPGLHVQMDLQSGKRKARLIGNRKARHRKAKERIKTWDAGEKIGFINTEKKRFTREQLKEALKDFKYKDLESEVKEEKKDKEQKKFRSYDELKKVMQDAKMSVKTEGEIVTELLSRLQNPSLGKEEAVLILTDLEYYLHQIDNARLFSDQGGLNSLRQFLNKSDPDIRAGAAHSLGAALQSNVQVQVAAMDSGLMQQLVTILSVDTSLQVRKKSLFALSTLIRQFPFAQKRFLDIGGLQALADLFVAAKEEKLKIKIVTLLTDLLVEYDFNIQHIQADDSVQSQRSMQYKEIELRKTMSSSGWCSLMTSLLQSLSGHDSVEKLITAMSALANTCKQDFSPARSHLQSLLSQYRQLAQEEKDEGQDDFFTSIYSSLENLVGQIVRDDL